MAESVDELFKLANQARLEHRPDDAKLQLIEAVALCRESGVPLDLAKAVTALGQIERDLHHGDAALQHYEEALVIYQAEGDGLRVAHTIRHVGDIHLDVGRLGQLYASVNVEAGVAESKRRLALLEQRRDHND